MIIDWTNYDSLFSSSVVCCELSLSSSSVMPGVLIVSPLSCVASKTYLRRIFFELFFEMTLSKPAARYSSRYSLAVPVSAYTICLRSRWASRSHSRKALMHATPSILGIVMSQKTTVKY